MKYRYTLATGTLLFIIAAFFGCKSEDEKDVKFSSELLKLNETSIELSKDASTRSVAIDADCDWDVAVTANNWSDLVVQKESQTNIGIQTGENPLRTDRTATLTISTKGGLNRTVNIRQAQGTAYIRTDVKNLSFTENGGSQAFHIQSNTSWQISLSGDSEWIKIANDDLKGNGSKDIVVTAAQSVVANARQATLSITSTESGVTLDPVLVEASIEGLKNIEFSVSPLDNISFGCLAGEADARSITITTNASWNIQIMSPSSNNDWLHLNETKGTYTKTVLLTCDDNTTASARQTSLAIMAGGYMDSIVYINVYQEAGQAPAISGFTNVGSIENIKEPAAFTFSYESLFPVTAYGLCYSTDKDMPTIDDEHTTLSATDKTATVSVKTETLQSRKTYYVRAYATNAVGTAYSEQAIKVTTVGDAPDVDDNPPLFVPKR